MMDIAAAKKRAPIECDAPAHCGCWYARAAFSATLEALEEAQQSAAQAWQWYNREAATAGELIHAASERAEAQGKLDAVRVLSQEMRKDGDDYVAGYGQRLDAILRGDKEEDE